MLTTLLRHWKNALFIVFSIVLLSGVFGVSSVSAATCLISGDTVIDQSYVTSNSCTSINITASVSTTWIGTVDLGGGTVTVTSGNIMTVGTSSQITLGASDDFVIQSNATTTHNAEDSSGVRITARNVTISGELNVSEKGCRGRSGGTGYGPNTSTGVCTVSTSGYGQSGRGGAAHGGTGGNGGGESNTQTTTYGSVTAPILLGSGGAGVGSVGGYGGGRVYINASGTLTVNGKIYANGGQAGTGDINGNGGGSGGSIYILAGTLAGSGSIQAKGGNALQYGGTGGGGRIALYYTNNTDFSLASQVVFSGGTGTNFGGTGGPGSFYSLNRLSDDGDGNLYVGGTFDFPSGDYTRTSITFASSSVLTCGNTSDISISAATVLMSGTTWTCSSAISNIYVTGTSSLYATSTTWNFTSLNNLVVDAQTTFNNNTSTWSVTKSGSRAAIYTPLTHTFGSFTFNGAYHMGTTSATGGRLVLREGINLSLISSTLRMSMVSSTFSALSLDSSSIISTEARGCRSAYGPNTTTGICASATSGYGKSSRGGAAHAGRGGKSQNENNEQTTTYGSSTNPLLPGSGGAAPDGYAEASSHNDGGGIIRLIVSGTLTNDGTISSKGGKDNLGGDGRGGGAGGSIYIYTSTLTGSGSITASGGDAGTLSTARYGGGGGGGRIALYYSSFGTFNISNVTVDGGLKAQGSDSDNAQNGGTGSIYTFVTNQAPSDPGSLGPTALVNGSTTGTNTPEFTFTLSDPDVSDTVRYRIQIDDSSDFSSPVVDYTSALQAQGSAAFTVGQAEGSGAYTLGSAGQTLSNGSYYWRVKAADAATVESSYSTANSGAVAFIVDVTTRYIGFAQTSESALESVTATSIRITLSQTHFEDVSVAYSVTGGTATGGGQDYTLASGTATISAGDTSTTIALVIVDDQIDESDETIEITLSAPTFATIGSNTTTSYTITDNDIAGVTLTESGGSTAVAEGGATDSFTIVLDTQPESTVSISFTTSSLGVSLSTSTIAFTSANWDTPVTVTVTAYDDQVAESTHTATITRGLSTSAYGYSVMSDQDTSVTVTDNDTAGVTVSTSSLSLSEGGASSTYTVVLQSAPTTTVTVTLTNSANDVLYTPTTLSFTSSNWATPQTVTVGAVDDTDYESTHTDTISHVASSAGYGYTAALVIGDVTATITDNESSDIQLSASSFSGTEGEAKTYTIVLASSPASDVVITLNSQSRFVSVSPSTLTFTSGNWNAPQTVSITLVNNRDYEGARTTGVTQAVASSAPGFSSVSLPTIEVIITDDDNPGGGATAASTALPPPITVITLPPPVTSVDAGSEPTSSNAPDAIPNQPGRLPATTPPAAVLTGVSQSAKAFGVTLPQALQQEVAIFIDQGTNNPRVEQLGAGERKAVFHDALDTMKDKVNIADLERIAIGEIPVNRNLAQERLQVPRALTTFKTIYGHAPNFKNEQENLAWNTLMYRLRFERDLAQERQGIQQFQRIFGRAPRDPFQWSTVRVLGYIR